MNLKLEQGQKVLLKGFSATKLHLYYKTPRPEENYYSMIHGYISDNKLEEIEVESFVGGDTIIATNGKLYPLRPDEGHGYSDFYAVVIKENKDG